MRYLSVCSGIEAATVAWHPLGWQPLAFSEIEPFPRAVLAHHYPEVPRHGDFTTIGDEYGQPDLLVGGTPCQSFSVAGLRGGLADERGNLALEYLRLAGRLGVRWVVWENVPGVLSSNGGRDFGAFLGGLVQLGYGFAYRVLDAQFFGVPQRRRRVFVVGYLGDWRRAAAVLFERHSLQGHPPPRREEGEGVAARAGVGSYGGGFGKMNDVTPCLQASGGLDERGIRNPLLISSTGDTAHCLNAGGMGRQDYETETLITHSLRGEGFDASEDGTGCGTPLVSVAFGWQNSASQGDRVSEHVTPSLDKSKTPAVCWQQTMPTLCRDPGGPASQDWQQHAAVITGTAVRRLTPRECERLQGFPDDYTLVPYRGKPAADGPRYKALGNSFAVPVVRWIGERIAMVERIPASARAAT